MAEDWQLTDDEAVAAEDAALSASYGAFMAKRAALADAAQRKLWAHIWPDIRIVSRPKHTKHIHGDPEFGCLACDDAEAQREAMERLEAMNAALGQKEQS